MTKDCGETPKTGLMTEFQERLSAGLFEDTALQRLLTAWFEANDSITPEFVESDKAYDVSKSLTLNADGTHTLTIPTNLTPHELKQIVSMIDSDTFGNKEDRAAAGAKSLSNFGEMLVGSGEYIAEHLDGAVFVNPDGRRRVEDLALGLYNFGNQLISDDKPEQVTEIKDIKPVEGEDNPERAEHLDNIRQFVGNMVFRDSSRVLKPEYGGRLSDQSMIQHLGYVAGKTVKSGRANEAESQAHTKADSPIDKFINRFLDQLDSAPIGARQGLETAALRRGMKFLQEKMKAAGYDDVTVKEKLGFDEAAVRLAELRQQATKTGDYTELAVAELDITDRLNKLISEIDRKENTNNPKQMIENREINCVGASLLAGSLLGELGIDYRVVGMPGHSCLAVITSDRQMYWRDMLGDALKFKFAITDHNFLGGDSVSSVIHDPGRITEMTIDNPGYSFVKKVFRARLYPPILGQQVQMLHNLGILMSKKGDSNVAIAAYNQALRLDPNNPGYYSNRGVAYYGKGNYDQAIADYNKSIELDPNNPGYYSNRGNAYRNKGNYDQAIADYNKAIELNPSNPIFYNNRGNAYYNKGNYDQAIANYIKALTLDGRHDNAWHNLRIVLQNVDNTLVNRAMEHDLSLIEELSQRYPMNGDA
jgi:Tfp pilus assembly protein PilF